MNEEFFSELIVKTNFINECFERVEYDKAITALEEAILILPEPKFDWESSTWLYSSLGEAHFLKFNYNESLNAFNQALLCPNSLDNAFINIRIGQCYFELKNMELATEYLLRAYMIAGQDIFTDEEEKYFTLISRKL